MDQNLSDIITVYNPDNEPFEVIYDNKSYGVISPQSARRFPRYLARLAVKHLIDKMIIKSSNGNHPVNDITEREKWGKQIVIDEENMTPVVQQSESERLRDEVERLNKTSDLDMILSRHKATSQPSIVNENGKVTPATPADIPPPPEFKPQQYAPQPLAQPTGEGATILPSAEEQDATQNIPPAIATPPATQVQPASEPLQSPTSPVEPAPAAPIAPTVTDTPVPANNGETLSPLNSPPEAPTRDQIYNFARNTLMMDLTDQNTITKLDQMSVPELIDTLKYEPAL